VACEEGDDNVVLRPVEDGTHTFLAAGFPTRGCDSSRCRDNQLHLLISKLFLKLGGVQRDLLAGKCGGMPKIFVSRSRTSVGIVIIVVVVVVVVFARHRWNKNRRRRDDHGGDLNATEQGRGDKHSNCVIDSTSIALGIFSSVPRLYRVGEE